MEVVSRNSVKNLIVSSPNALQVNSARNSNAKIEAVKSSAQSIAAAH